MTEFPVQLGQAGSVLYLCHGVSNRKGQTKKSPRSVKCSHASLAETLALHITLGLL